MNAGELNGWPLTICPMPVFQTERHVRQMWKLNCMYLHVFLLLFFFLSKLVYHRGRQLALRRLPSDVLKSPRYEISISPLCCCCVFCEVRSFSGSALEHSSKEVVSWWNITTVSMAGVMVQQSQSNPSVLSRLSVLNWNCVRKVALWLKSMKVKCATTCCYKRSTVVLQIRRGLQII